MFDARSVRARGQRGRAATSISPFAALFCWLFSLATVLAFAPVAGAEPELSRVGPNTLSLELGVGLVLFGGAVLLPRPTVCRWCDPPDFDQALALPVTPSERRTAGAMSHVFSYVTIPTLVTTALVVPPLTTSEAKVHAGENVALAAEVVLLDLALNLAIKKWVARRRPAFYYDRLRYTEYQRKSKEANVSFFSGDTSAAFSAASAAATISFLRGYQSAPYVTAAGATLATATGLLRIGADVHWPSDVLTGALVGTALGIAVPLLLHPRLRAGSEASPSSGQAPLATPAPGAPMWHFSAAF